MKTLVYVLGGIAALLITGLFVGCGSSAATTASPQPSSPQPTAVTTAESDLETGLAQLSREDQALARQQKVCPVSGATLGSMGKPYKIEVQGRTVFLCCSGCEAEVRKEPDKFLNKLDTVKP